MIATRVIRTVMAVCLMTAALTAGCSYFKGDRLEAYGLTSPVSRNEPVYEDPSLRVAFSVIDDRLIDMAVTNKTGRSMRIFWANSTFAAVDDPNAEIAYILRSEQPGPVGHTENISNIQPGESLDVETFPLYDAFNSLDLVPLYENRDGKGDIESLYGKSLGVNLVMEINGSTRMYKFRLDLTPHKSDGS